MKSRYEGIQNKLWGIREGCFFITLCSIAEEYNLEHGDNKVDLIDAVNKAYQKGLLGDDYWVKDDCKILEFLTGKKVRRRQSQTCGILDDNEYSAAKWLNKAGTANHFRRRYFDVYLNSKTVKEGTLVCYYIYTIG